MDRNLFTSSRSAVPKREVSLNVPPPSTYMPETITPPEVVLSGIIKNQYDEFVAYLSVDGGLITGVRVGDTLGDLEVLEVEDRKVQLKWKDSLMTLDLKSSSLMKR